MSRTLFTPTIVAPTPDELSYFVEGLPPMVMIETEEFEKVHMHPDVVEQILASRLGETAAPETASQAFVAEETLAANGLASRLEVKNHRAPRAKLTVLTGRFIADLLHKLPAPPKLPKGRHHQGGRHRNPSFAY